MLTKKMCGAKRQTSPEQNGPEAMAIKLLKTISGIALLCLLATQPALAETVYYYHTDPVGTPLAMTDSKGIKVWEADYLPFGEVYMETGAVNDRKFVGKERDEESQLDYFGARYHYAKIGRFLAPDPVRAVDVNTGRINAQVLADPQGGNVYAYSLNNPYSVVDPDGRSPLYTPNDGQIGLYAGGGGGGGYKVVRPITNPRQLLPAPKPGVSSPHTEGGELVSFRVGRGGMDLPRGRAHGDGSPAGGFLSETPIPNQGYVRSQLATKPEWSSATKVSDAHVPEGVVLQRSVAGPQGYGHPGGGVQLEILNAADKARIVYSNTKKLGR
ncbi:MAG: RHS domain-containing protein [Desulfuromonadales bacterium]|nr:RHS domain-containing protein [Desulfuromonadales bacterium]